MASDKAHAKIKSQLNSEEYIARELCKAYDFKWDELSREAIRAFRRIARRSRDTVASAILETAKNIKNPK